MKEILKAVGGITLEVAGSFLIGLSVVLAIFGVLYGLWWLGWALGFQM